MPKLFFLFILLSFHCFGQKKCKRVNEKVYEACINYNFSGKGRNIIVENITNNTDIKSLNFADLLKFDAKRRIKLLALDSTWIPIILSADNDKVRLLQCKIPRLKIAGFFIDLNDDDSSSNIDDAQGRWSKKSYFVDSRLTVSDVIFHKNKAIVSLTRNSGSSDGEAVVYFLEKKKRKWKVVSFTNVWVS